MVLRVFTSSRLGFLPWLSRISPALIMNVGERLLFVQLYILPVSHEDEFKLSEGYFFTCEDIRQNPEKFSNELRIECDRLHMVAQIWKEFK